MPKKKRKTAKAGSAAPGARALHYKVVELSNVDEGALERTLNEWVPRGWSFDGVQFAMRESSKRPAMAFVFFTRPGAAVSEAEPAPAYREPAAAERHLTRIVGERRQEPPAADAWSRLEALVAREGERRQPGSAREPSKVEGEGE